VTNLTCTLALPELCGADAVVVYIGQADGQVKQVNARCRTHRNEVAFHVFDKMRPRLEWYSVTTIKPVGG
jgi:hypothetical protein